MRPRQRMGCAMRPRGEVERRSRAGGARAVPDPRDALARELTMEELCGIDALHPVRKPPKPVSDLFLVDHILKLRVERVQVALLRCRWPLELLLARALFYSFPARYGAYVILPSADATLPARAKRSRRDVKM